MEGPPPRTGTPRALSSHAQRDISCDTQEQMLIPVGTTELGPKVQENVFSTLMNTVYAAHGEQREALASQWDLHTPFLRAPNAAGPVQHPQPT